MKKNTFHYLPSLCALIGASGLVEAGSVTFTATPSTNYGADVVATLQSNLITADDGLATFQLAVDITPSSGTAIVTNSNGYWGVNDESFTGTEAVQSIGNLRVINFTANGSVYSAEDIKNLSFKVVTYAGATGSGDTGSVSIGGTVHNWQDMNANVPQFSGHSATGIDVYAANGDADVTDFSIAATGTSSSWRIASIEAAYQEVEPLDPGFAFSIKQGSTAPYKNPVSEGIDSVIAGNADWYRAESLESKIPEKMAAGQNGYVIVTTEEYKNRLTKLDDYVAHKTGLGFRMLVVTEKDYDPEGLTTVGLERGLAIRQWLHENYDTEKLLYAMLLGNPDPEEGDVPMIRVRGTVPSDYPFADVNGSNMDLDGDGRLFENGDMGEDGVDYDAEIYIGRMMIYGDDHPYARVEDMDIILQRNIDWENDTSDLSWRHDVLFANVGNVGPKRFSMIRNGFTDPLGARSCWVMSDWGDRYPALNETGGNVILRELNSHPYGILQFHGHGTPLSIVGSISTAQVQELTQQKVAGFGYAGGCTIAKPDEPMNITWALVRFATMGFCGASQPISNLSSVGDGRQSWAYMAPIFWGQSNGEAFWETSSYAARKRGNGLVVGDLQMNYYGDPSVVTVPKRVGRDLVLAPNALMEINHEFGRTDKAEYFDYTVKNNGSTSASYQFVANDTWLSASPSNFTLAPGESITMAVGCDSMGSLPIGKNYGSFDLTSTNAATQTREVIADHYLPASLDYASCENANTFKSNSLVTTGKWGNGVPFSDTKYDHKWFNNPVRQNYAISFWTKFDTVADGEIYKKPEVWDVSVVNGKFQFRVYQNLFEGAEYMGEDVAFRVPTILSDPSAIVADQWYHLVFNMDIENHTISAYVNGTEVAQATLPYSHLATGDTGDHTFGTKNGTFSGVIDEIWMLRKYLTQEDIDALGRGGFAMVKSPELGAVTADASTTLQWDANAQAISYDVYFGADQAAVAGATTSSAEFVGNISATSQVVSPTEGANFWRVDVVTASGTNKGFISNFTRDSAFTNSAPVWSSEVDIANWQVGSTDPLHDLMSNVTDADPDAVLTFEQLSGPDWVTIPEDGLMVSAYGPSASDVGENTFEVKVTDQWGASATTTFTINVIQ